MELLQQNFRIFKKDGFISIVAFIILLILGIFGIAYWAASRLSTDMILKESHRIKARNLAQAGIEKVRVNIMNQYRMGKLDMRFPPAPEKATAEEYAIDFGDGYYRVKSVSPYSPPGSGKVLLSIPYFKNRVKIGSYDVWNIVVESEIPSSGVTARVETLVKILRMTNPY